MKFTNKEEVHNWALQALGKTVGELQALMPNKKTSKKSIYGDAWESWFGVDKNNIAGADLESVGVELKATPLKENRKGMTAKERLVLNKINYIKEFEISDINESDFLKKNQVLEIGFYFYEAGVKSIDFKFLKAMQYMVPEKDWLIIKNDWERIHSYIKQGKASHLSGSLTNILEACPKAANSKSRTPQHPSLNVEEAKPRAFAFKNSYMATLVKDYLYGDKVDENIQVDYFKQDKKNTAIRESIISNIKELENNSLEELILSKINKYKGKTISELAEIFSVDTTLNPKHLLSLIVGAILNIKNDLDQTEEFAKSGIQLKTIRLEEDNRPKEHMSFPAFDFEDLINETWEESALFNNLEQSKFLFVVFKNVNGQYVLKGAKFWSMPMALIDSKAKDVWERTRDIIKNGVELELVKWGSKWRVNNNLPKASDNGSIMHVRPHTIQKSYVRNQYSSRLPVRAKWKNKPTEYSDQYMTKQSFWFNNDFISEQVKEFWE